MRHWSYQESERNDSGQRLERLILRTLGAIAFFVALTATLALAA